MGGQAGHVLVLDDESVGLGRLSMELVDRGLDVVYANDVDELSLLSRERGGPALLVVAPTERALEMRCKIGKRVGLGADRVVPAGNLPSDEVVEEIRGLGMRWTLWTCTDAKEAHYVVNAAAWEVDTSELRFDARAPSRLDATVDIASKSLEIVIDDLSAGGARTLWSERPPINGSVGLAFSLADRPVELRARVAWTRQTEPGFVVGLAFSDVGAQTDKHIRSFVKQWLGPHRLQHSSPRS